MLNPLKTRGDFPASCPFPWHVRVIKSQAITPFKNNVVIICSGFINLIDQHGWSLVSLSIKWGKVEQHCYLMWEWNKHSCTHIYTQSLFSLWCSAIPVLTSGNYERYFNMIIYAFIWQTFIDHPELLKGNGCGAQYHVLGHLKGGGDTVCTMC